MKAVSEKACTLIKQLDDTEMQAILIMVESLHAGETMQEAAAQFSL